MNISVSITSEELNELGFDEGELEHHIIDCIDADNKEMVGFGVSVTVD